MVATAPNPARSSFPPVSSPFLTRPVSLVFLEASPQRNLLLGELRIQVERVGPLELCERCTVSRALFSRSRSLDFSIHMPAHAHARSSTQPIETTYVRVRAPSRAPPPLPGIPHVDRSSA